MAASPELCTSLIVVPAMCVFCKRYSLMFSMSEKLERYSGLIERWLFSLFTLVRH